MKKYKTKKLLAIVLSVVMITLQSGPAFATETVSGPQNAVSENGSQPEIPRTETGGGSEPEMETGADQDDETGNEAEPEDEQVSGNEAEPEDEQVSGNESQETVSEDAAGSEGELPFGLKGMPEGYTLSEKQIEAKKSITEHNVPGKMETLTAGEDYVADEVIFSCDDPEYAKVVADAYNGTLQSCELGVAVIRLDTSRVTVKDAVTAGADIMTTLPPVEANILTKLTDPVPSEGKGSEIADPFAGAGIMAAKKNAIDKRNWTYWYDKWKDYGLNPGYVAKDDDSKTDKNMYQWMHDATGTYAAWGMTRGEGVTVAVIDTGVYDKHPELAGQVTGVLHKMEKPSEEVDDSGHGTHVAGIIAASANGVGPVGIAPKAKILAYPIFSKNGCSSADQARAVNDVANNGSPKAQVINMSLGGPVYSQIDQEAINNAHNAGVTVCVAMGNDSANDVCYPAALDNVIAVAALDESRQKSDFSTHGSWADIAAPGTAIYSSWNGHYDETETGGGKNVTQDYPYYSSWNGTSMATPVVAGICALYISAMGGKADPDDVEKAIKKTATKVSSPYRIGAGMINAAALLKTVEDTSAPVIGMPGTVSANQYVTFGSNSKSGTLGYIYTVNGKKPNAVSGEVKEGFYVEAEDDGTAKVLIATLLDNGLPAGETGKLMVSRITGLGTMTDPSEQIISVEGGATAGMSIVGSDILAKGKSLTYRLNRKLPKNSVKWKLEGAPAGVTINAKSGKVSSKGSSGGSFTIVAETSAGNVSKKVDLVDGATAVTLLAPGADKDPDRDVNIPVKGSNGNIKSARLYNVDVRNTTRVENVIKLDGKTVGNTAPVIFSSSKPSVATVDGTGKVTAKKAGTVKITCKAGDGSGKKATVTIKVIVPVSKLGMFLDKDMQAVCYGKTMKVRAAIGSAYGKPTIKKLEWDKDPVRVLGYSSGSSRDVTAQIKEAGLISVKNGKLKVDKKIGLIEGYDCFSVTVKAKATDGSGIVLEKGFEVVPPTRILRVDPDNESIKNKTKEMPAYGGEDGILLDAFTGDMGLGYTRGHGGKVLEPQIKSSDPKVASAKLYKLYGCKDGIGYRLMIITKKTGTANITVYATDGSGKKATLKVKSVKGSK